MKKEETKNISGLYIKVNSGLKKDFYVYCIKNNTNMSEEIVKFMKKSIKGEK